MFCGIPNIKNFVGDWLKIIMFLVLPIASAGIPRILGMKRKRSRKRHVCFFSEILVREFDKHCPPCEFVRERCQSLDSYSRKDSPRRHREAAIETNHDLRMIRKVPEDEYRNLSPPPRASQAGLSYIRVDKSHQKNYEDGAEKELTKRRLRKRKHDSSESDDCDGGSRCECHKNECPQKSLRIQ
ncbi:hypothetical protein GE061_010975 [Apolygus lucorum]|uniref:Uncharacterized protein n=1 Tax=Apolygus lucorum TaxID=248454 RepID=A0A8S9XWH8_APOLU|nr:hypothetical protein GE061_010975 [Apolygus lucorum]